MRAGFLYDTFRSISLDYRSVSLRPLPKYLILLVLLGDVLFIAALGRVDRVLGLDVLPAGWGVHLLQQDRSAAELYAVLQALGAAGLLAVLSVVRRSPVHVAWAAIFLFVAADDWYQVHENLGGIVAMSRSLPDPGVLRKQDVGELIVWAVAASVLFGFLGLATWRSGREGVRFSLTMLLPFGLLVLAAVGLDMLHQLLGASGGAVETLMILAEDGGEMLAITGCLWVVLRDGSRDRPVARG